MASKYRKKFELPAGFYEVLEDYSREVLRDQPLDIVEFSYLYFKSLEEVSAIPNLTIKSLRHTSQSRAASHKLAIVHSLIVNKNGFTLALKR